MDGWHVVYGYEVYVENGKVLRGTAWENSLSQKTVYPYRSLKTGGWWNISGEISLSALRSGMKRGTIILT